MKLLQSLEKRSVPFRLSVVGEQFRNHPPAFEQIHQQFESRIEQWGFLESRQAYDRLLARADIVLSTALHDFQGLSMLEAMASGCIPLAPDRLAYREYVPEVCRYASVEENVELEAEAAANCLQNLIQRQPPHSQPEPWRASLLADQYQRLFNGLIHANPDDLQ